MPRGIPKSGFRIRYGKPEYFGQKAGHSFTEAPDVVDAINEAITETDEEIAAKLDERFAVIKTLAESCIIGDARSLIVSGGAGLGKSFTVEQCLNDWNPRGDKYTIVKGYCRPTGLMKLLYQHREEMQIIVMDDADSIFYDDVSLNILKAVCDTTENRNVSWLSETKMVDEDSGQLIPRSFDFKGSIIFLTNLDMVSMVNTGHKLKPHLEALMSRSYYIDCGIKTKRDYLVRIRQVIGHGLLKELTDIQKKDVLNFIEENYINMRELSLRMAIKVGIVRKNNPDNWQNICKVTCCK
jgi:hypothetical protein